MLTVAYDGKLNKYTRQLVVSKVDNEILLKAKTSFNRYREKNIILNGLFDDNTWLVCDEKYRYTIDFDYDDDLFLYNAGKWIGCDSECYRKCIKAYVVFNFGNLMLESLHRLAREFSLIAGYELEHVLKICEYPNHLAELLKILPDESESRDYIIEQIEDNIQFGARKQKPNNQRLLADFNSYLNFEECLNEYWSVAPDQKKLFYFPIFFWWKLTSILPLRPTEYLLTPRNCLQMNSNGENVITIRRTKLKGGQANITYKIDGDYEKKKYIIPHMLADEIKKYVIMTDDMKLSNIGTLISRQPYCESIKFSSKIADKFFTYSDLSLTLDCFLSELKRNDIKVRLGDTRHIAMASLIISGGSPTICKELAGHSDIVSFKSLDIDALLKNNKSHEKLRKALHELNDFWHQIYLRAGDVAMCNRKLLSEQTQLSETIKVQTLKSDESLKQYDVLKFECNKLIVENRYLRKMLRQYLYPSLANEILKSENMMIGINESENISDMAKKDKLYNEMPDTFDNMISADIKLYSRENKLFEQLSHQVKGE